MNIVDIAAGSDDFNLLALALGVDGLDDYLRDQNDITVFAPTDVAFTALATDLGYNGDTSDEAAVFNFIVEQLTVLGGGDPLPLLGDILTYHVISPAQLAAEIDAADTVHTWSGFSFTTEGTELVDYDPEAINPNIVAPDIQTDNGVIQVIDRVLPRIYRRLHVCHRALNEKRSKTRLKCADAQTHRSSHFHIFDCTRERIDCARVRF